MREEEVMDSRVGPDGRERSFRGGELSRSQREYLNQQKMLYANLDRKAARKEQEALENQSPIMTRGSGGFPLPKAEVRKAEKRAKKIAGRAAATLALAVSPPPLLVSSPGALYVGPLEPLGFHLALP